MTVKTDGHVSTPRKLLVIVGMVLSSASALSARWCTSVRPRTPAAKRGELLGAAALVIPAAREDLGPLLIFEQGKPLREARLEIRPFVHTLEHYAGLAAGSHLLLSAWRT